MASLKETIQRLFLDFSKKTIFDETDRRQKEHGALFRDFWQQKIVNPQIKELREEADIDPIIRLLDVKAKGSSREIPNYAVAQTGIRQGVWRRMFKHLKQDATLCEILSNLLSSREENERIKWIDRLKEANEGRGNGLTGNRANALNAILFLYYPSDFMSVVSLRHRFMILEKLELAKADDFLKESYGEQVIRSNRLLLEGLRKNYGLNGTPRQLSEFLYQADVRPLWQQDEILEEEQAPTADEAEIENSVSGDASTFALEKHLENFLVANWEQSELGKKYELIEDNGEIVSQQYRTDIGFIDLLVKDKKGKNYVVIELKRGQTSDSTVGQVLRYMNWVKKHRANGKEVKGIVIALDADDKMRYALADLTDKIELFTYRVDFILNQVKAIAY